MAFLAGRDPRNVLDRGSIDALIPSPGLSQVLLHGNPRVAFDAFAQQNVRPVVELRAEQDLLILLDPGDCSVFDHVTFKTELTPGVLTGEFAHEIIDATLILRTEALSSDPVLEATEESSLPERRLVSPSLLPRLDQQRLESLEILVRAGLRPRPDFVDVLLQNLDRFLVELVGSTWRHVGRRLQKIGQPCVLEEPPPECPQVLHDPGILVVDRELSDHVAGLVELRSVNPR